jgi:biopolymer transport protein ExbD
MIDVVFLLLVFFAATMSFGQKGTIEHLFSQPGGAPHPPVVAKLTPAVEGGAHLTLDGHPTAIGEVSDRIRAMIDSGRIGPVTPIVVDADPQVPWDAVLIVYNDVRYAGVGQVGFAR